jgi:2-aminoethylphosphonate-pyruvate transaminase
MSRQLLFTPGPLTTSRTVRDAMARDIGSRDTDFTAIVQTVRAQLVDLAAPAHPDRYCAVLLPGSGTYAIEATIGTVVPDAGCLLIAINGAYGERMRHIADRLKVPHRVLRIPDDQPIEADALQAALDAAPDVTHAAIVHCETTTGLLNPLAAIAGVAASRGITLIVDAMSSFGALPIDMHALGIHYLVASSNKCLEGVPGLGFVVAERRNLLACRGQARGFSLDLAAQLAALDTDGQFRFTPPTHVTLALAQALDELADEGGLQARGGRYAHNQRRLVALMRAAGVRTYLPDERHGPIITTFLSPPGPAFVFEQFYQRLHERGFVIYPGKLTAADTFRIGSIGQLFEDDMVAMADAVRDVLAEMGVTQTAQAS